MENRLFIYRKYGKNVPGLSFTAKTQGVGYDAL
jgi:hypothetical protein